MLSYHDLPPPLAFLVRLEPHLGMGHVSSVRVSDGGFATSIAIISELPGCKREDSDKAKDRSPASVISKSPNPTSKDPGPFSNLFRIIASNISKSYSEGTGNFRPRASSQTRGS